MKKEIFKLSACVSAGVSAGFVNGLFGTGGGIILVFALTSVFKDQEEYTARDIFASVIAAILPMSLVSIVSYIESGNVSFADASPYMLSGLVGGVIGAYLLDRINVKLLKHLFAVMVIYAGIKMIL